MTRLRIARPRSPFVVFNALLLGFFIVGLLYPISRSIVRVFYHDGRFDLSGFSEFAASSSAVQSVPTTFFVVGCASAISTAIGFVLAYFNERTDARMGIFTDMVPFVPLLMPSIAGAYGWVLTMAPNIGYANAVWSWAFGGTGPFNIYSMPALIFVYSIHGTTFAFLIISAALRNLDPSLEEQARLCGAGRLRIAFQIVARSLLPSIAAAFLLVVWTSTSTLAVPAVIGQPAGIPIMSVQILRFLNYDYPPQYGPALVTAMIMVGFIGIVWFAASQVRKLGRHATVGGKTRVATRRALGIWKWPVRGIFILWVVIVVLVPLVALSLVALNGYWSINLDISNLSFRFFGRLFAPGSQLFTALTNSLRAAVIVATVGSFLAAAISAFVTSRKGHATTIADAVFKLPTILPGLVLAIGFVLAYAGAPFSLGGTLAILILAFLLEHVPKGTLMTDPVAAQVGNELTEAAQVSGASGLFTLWKIQLPLMVPGIVLVWALTFVHVVADLDTSALLAGPSNPTIGALMLELGENGNFASLTALALLVVMLTSTTVAAVFLFTRRRSAHALALSN